jgi:C_GCAxxG_C_C family probable redox protein
MARSGPAQEAFKAGFSCSQAVLTAFSGEFGLRADVANRIACGFGGGMARRSQTCGAVSGALMVIGLKYGKTEIDDKDAKETTYARVNEFCRNFEEEYGSINCRELLDCDLSTKEGQQKFKDNDYFNQRCMKFVKKACDVLESMGFIGDPAPAGAETTTDT